MIRFMMSLHICVEVDGLNIWHLKAKLPSEALWHPSFLSWFILLVNLQLCPCAPPIFYKLRNGRWVGGMSSFSPDSNVNEQPSLSWHLRNGRSQRALVTSILLPWRKVLTSLPSFKQNKVLGSILLSALGAGRLGCSPRFYLSWNPYPWHGAGLAQELSIETARTWLLCIAVRYGAEASGLIFWGLCFLMHKMKGLA